MGMVKNLEIRDCHMRLGPELLMRFIIVGRAEYKCLLITASLRLKVPTSVHFHDRNVNGIKISIQPQSILQ